MTRHHDSDEQKGGVEEETPSRNTSGRSGLAAQLGHRTADLEVKDNDSDFPEPGAREEHSGEKRS